MKKNLFVLATLLSVAALSSCGGDNTSSASVTPASSSEAPVSEASSVTSKESSASIEDVSSVVISSVDASSDETSSVTSVDLNVGVGTEAEPANVADAVAAALTLPESNYDSATISTKVSYVKGYVASITIENRDGVNKYNMNLVTSSGYTVRAIVFRADLKEGVTAPVAGDEVVVSGNLQNWLGDGEIVNATVLSSKHAFSPVVVNITNGSVTGLPENLSVESGSTQKFNVVPNDGYKVENVKVNNVLVTPGEDGSYSFVAGFNDVIDVSIIENSAIAETCLTVSMIDAFNRANEAATTKVTSTGEKLEELPTGDENVTIKSDDQSGNNSKQYGTVSLEGVWTAANWRFYATNHGAFTVTCKYNINKISVTLSGGSLKVGETDYVSGEEIEVNAKSITFTAVGIAKITDICVYYTPSN